MIESPCIGVCFINDEHNFCNGCFRSREEITEWIALSDTQKKEVIQLTIQRQIDIISF
ncbi:MAG: DUF1289 domain-containing protein [Methylophilaceae bacterium]